MRTFLAIPLPESLVPPVESLRDRLAAGRADVKWVDRSNFHFTIRFLGEIESHQVERVKSTVRSLANHPAFLVEMGKVGAFPSLSAPRVIWVGLVKGHQEMQELSRELENALFKLGFIPEVKPFHTHLTLGRARSERWGTLKELLYKEPGLTGYTFQANQLSLYASTLTPQGPIYRALETVNWKEK
jgi:2'-5' RNA ligase